MMELSREIEIKVIWMMVTEPCTYIKKNQTVQLGQHFSLCKLHLEK